MYLVFIALSLGLSYFVLYFLFTKFFEHKAKLPKFKSIFSVILILVLSFVIDYFALSISDFDVSNRLLHAFGGGFLAFFVCFLVVRDSKLKISKFQFFIFSFLSVMTMGIGNEAIEFFAQNYSDFIFAPNINDTWLDLISNTSGALIAGGIFTPLIPKRP